MCVCAHAHSESLFTIGAAGGAKPTLGGRADVRMQGDVRMRAAPGSFRATGLGGARVPALRTGSGGPGCC